MNKERREFVRYPIKPRTIFVYSANAPVQGWGKDICKEGMAFEYISDDGCEPKPEIKLILTGDEFLFYLSELPCKTIYDVEVDTFRLSPQACATKIMDCMNARQHPSAFERLRERFLKTCQAT